MGTITVFSDPPIPVTGAGGLGTHLSCGIGDECRQANSPFNTVATAWGTAKLVIYAPFYVESPCTAYKMGFENGATINGNFDIGIYETDGTKLIAKGSTAHNTTSASAQARVDITDTPLATGTYLAALTFDGTTATVAGSPIPARAGRICGVQEQTTVSFGLPATATFAVYATLLLVPLIVIETRSIA